MSVEKERTNKEQAQDGEDGSKQVIIAARERGPGPGRYKLPSSCGYVKHDFSKHQKPAYPFGVRLADTMMKKDVSPGPAHFIDPKFTKHGKDGTPCYSMLGRQHEPNIFKPPGPGTYSPEKVHPQGERHAPIYTLRKRTRFRKRDKNPAPNVYSLPQLIGPQVIYKRAYPSYSMTARRHIGHFAEDYAKTPGPGRYNAIEPNTVRNKAAEYSLKDRSYMPGDTTQKPGPGAHRPERVVVNKPIYPKHSLGIRHSEFVCPLIVNVKD